MFLMSYQHHVNWQVSIKSQNSTLCLSVSLNGGKQNQHTLIWKGCGYSMETNQVMWKTDYRVLKWPHCELDTEKCNYSDNFLHVIHLWLPCSTCLLCDKYILRSGRKYTDSTYCWVPTSFKTVSLSFSPLFSHPSLLFVLTLSLFSIFLSLSEQHSHWQAERKKTAKEARQGTNLG